MPRHQAMYYEKLEEGRVRCVLCPHHCRLKKGETGLCGVRLNQGGELYTENYEEISSLALDPIEKKPLYHFYPGSNILSLGTFGCNLFCPFCQNYSLAHAGRTVNRQGIGEPGAEVTGSQMIPRPGSYVRNGHWLETMTLQAVREGSVGVAFTYNEPSIWYEYVLECAARLQELGQKVVLVTNGYIEREPLRHLLPLVDAMNIDVKSFDPEFYKKHCRGKLEKVMENVELAASECHVEITTLIIPGENDDPAEIGDLATWLAGIDPHIPLHLSRYHPAFTFDRPATPEDVMVRAREKAREHLDFVYLGNLAGETNSTACLNCGEVLIQRNLYQTRLVHLTGHSCSSCGMPIDYIKY
ncbi:MAG: radical SAM protein [Deltaproteobacteria bacterium]